MSWLRQLPNRQRRGSRPRCLLFVDGSRREVSGRLTRLVDLPDVTVSARDRWAPFGKPVFIDGTWDTQPSGEVVLSEPNGLVPHSIQRQLQTWWLAVPRGANAPNWDIVSTCNIRGEPGLLLVEAKAHSNELDRGGKSLGSDASPNSIKNHERIDVAIAEAATQFQEATGKRWDISRDHHYQLSNRFAWSWKLASLGIPVVLLYLGFLNAHDMGDRGRVFRSEAEWRRTLKDHSRYVIEETCWEEWLDFCGVPFIAIIRGIDQPFVSNDEEDGT